ncbi:BON domain-containing protein [Alteromonas sp. a30]|uniref:BON domain-containing protein n=1 Tax=Alteromonas sp. a30 TaxID=2730917 RepID=UPI0022802822|nr:BON domain-containing protein [Alteromonas sp. a30]MCY7294801.1 BON domain-containing protein [Alteromonas sp. a30]
MKARLSKLTVSSLLIIGSLGMSGCAALVVGGVGVSAVTVGEDERTVGTQIDDTTVANKITGALNKVAAIKHDSNISVKSFNGAILLTGQTPTASLRIEAENIALSFENIRTVYNQIRVGKPTAPSTRAYDIWLASKVRANLIADKHVDFLKMDVTVEDSEVFLMGLVTQNNADRAIEITRNLDGVTRVVNMFEIQ